jgi:polar amino acid transport system substrate-binding protein
MKRSILIFIMFYFISVNAAFSCVTRTIIIAGDEEDIYSCKSKTPKGEFNGICYAIVEKVAAFLDIKISYRLMPFDKLLQEARAGKVDAIIPVAKNRDKHEYLYFPENGIWVEEHYLFTLKKYGIMYSGDMYDLMNFPIGVVKGYSYGDKFDSAVNSKQIQTVVYPGISGVMEQLKKGEIKIGVGNRDKINYLKSKLKINDLVLLEPCISKDMLYLAFSKKKKAHEELAKLFSDGIETFRRSKEFQKILDDYGFCIPTVKLAANDIPPYYGPNMPNNGPIAEIIIEAFKRVGYEAKIDFVPSWSYLLKSAKNGKYAAGFTGFYSKEREKDYIFSNPLNIFCRFVFLKKKEMNIKIEKQENLEEDLKPYRIGVTHGYIYNFPAFNEMNGLKRVPAISNEVDINNLIKGRLDLVLVDKVIADYIIDKNFPKYKEDLDFIDLVGTTMDRHLLISRRFEDSFQLKRDFDYGLKQIKEDGTFDSIIKEYEEKYGYSFETNKK